MTPRRVGARLALALFATAWLAACASAPAPAPGPGGPATDTGGQPYDPAPAGPGPEPYYPPAGPGQAVSDLPGWAQEDHAAAFDAYVVSCHVRRDQTARAVCDRARRIADHGRPDPGRARAFFEANFTVEPISAQGLLTAYFAPEYAARRAPSAEFDAPILGVPDDLARRPGADGRPAYRRLTPDGGFATYPDRAAIDRGEAPAPVLGWMRAEDLFFLQIQGSGYLTFEDGGQARAAYAADNGHAFVGIARPMAERGLLPRDGTSGSAIAGWLARNRGERAREIMALNPRYIFFSINADDAGHPAGAAGVPLTPGRSVAVDPAHWHYGQPAWIVADGGNLIGARRGYQGLVMALDTGSAIRGPARADYYMGRGAAAGDEAGTVRHPLRMWRLVPRPSSVYSPGRRAKRADKGVISPAG